MVGFSVNGTQSFGPAVRVLVQHLYFKTNLFSSLL
jgi:hypothetical protein